MVLLLLWTLGCSNLQAPTTTVPLSDLVLARYEGRYYHLGERFTGVGTDHSAHRVLTERTAFVDGRRHGLREQWFSDGNPSAVTPYQDGRKHGQAKTWWRGGELRTDNQFENGVAHGTQLQWYASGRLFKERNIEHGTELGLQRAWRENGAIYNNYEALNGRIFGLRRSKLCTELTEEDTRAL